MGTSLFDENRIEIRLGAETMARKATADVVAAGRECERPT
jgi:hypothetical protein